MGLLGGEPHHNLVCKGYERGELFRLAHQVFPTERQLDMAEARGYRRGIGGYRRGIAGV